MKKEYLLSLLQVVARTLDREQADLGSSLHPALNLGCQPFKGQSPNKSCSPCTLQPVHKAGSHTQGWVWSCFRSHPCKMSKQGAGLPMGLRLWAPRNPQERGLWTW